MFYPRYSNTRSKRKWLWEIKWNMSGWITFKVWRGRLLFLQIYNCQYWIQAKLNVLDNVWTVLLLILQESPCQLVTEFAFPSVHFQDFFSSIKKVFSMKKYLGATLKLWLLGNFKHCLCELQDLCTQSRKQWFNGRCKENCFTCKEYP